MTYTPSPNYKALQKRLEKSPQGAPASEALFKIIEHLFTEKEAKLVSQIPINLFSAKKAAKIWNMHEKEAKEVLNELADKGLLLDIKKGNNQEYILAPTMAGFFEFSIMRTDGKFDRKLLSELYHQYINVEEDFIKQVLALEPNIARVFVQEDTVEKHEGVILDYERATKVIENATCVTVGTCYCRYKMNSASKGCDKPQEVCLSFNNAAKSLAKHGIAKEISKKKAMKLLNQCIKDGLVQVGDNVQDRASWICNCCGCCCEALLAYKKLGCAPRVSSNYLCKIDYDKCKRCGLCAKKCPVDAIEMKNRRPIIDTKKCLGCSVCTRFCPAQSMEMQRRKQRNFVPKDAFERFVLSAINEGKLQNLLVDNYKLWTYDILRKFLGIILNLPPAKQILASRQMQSRFMSWFTKTNYYDHYNLEFVDHKTNYEHKEMK
ncbi:4Fe-4S binding protein [Candidatus Woesearchaeota archaeon]|jgi:ferredoxin|nr:4Fe-4S binding protein [Candidatus Woesearchaeota archaeon]